MSITMWEVRIWLVRRYKKRDCFSRFKDYIYDDTTEKVLILYGLRRTGKTTLIGQVIADMNEDDLRCTAFIQIKASETLADVNSDLKKMEMSRYKYIFMDEVTQIKDFIEGAACFQIYLQLPASKPFFQVRIPLRRCAALIAAS